MKKLTCLLLLLFCTTAYAREDARVIDFHSYIQIETDGRIDVKETITVYADGRDIQRGIVRTLPCYRTDNKGKKIKVPIKVLSVLRDGKEEKFHTGNTDNEIEIRIGDSKVYLDPGVYEYTITYDSYGHIGFFDDYDELYWNVTGNDWAFKIEKATAVIKLPGETSKINTACYTGYAGDKGGSCTIEEVNNSVIFRTTQSLYRKQGLTVAVSFPRDIINRPPPPSKAELFWEEYYDIIASAAGLLIMGIFYLLTWLKVGKDPEKPIVIPTFKPPHGWPPVVVRFLFKRRYDEKAFTVTLLSMAIKGALRISYESKKFKLEALGLKENLLEKEKEIYNTLFTTNDTITVSNQNCIQFANANLSLKKSLKAKWNIKEYLLHNISYVVWATLLFILVLAGYIYVTETRIDYLALTIFLPFILMGIMFIRVGIKTLDSFNGVIQIIVGVCILMMLLSGEVFFLLQEIKSTVVFLLCMVLGYILNIYLIKAPTKLGAKTMSELKGFQMYLETAEENRLNLLTPPEHTPELFEAMLPYAIALDVENEWGEKFNDLLSKINYEPYWYNGNQPFRIHSFNQSFSNSFASSVQSAQIKSSSGGSGGWSSGSGGGGFSGGGGGGGGGGGW